MSRFILPLTVYLFFDVIVTGIKRIKTINQTPSFRTRHEKQKDGKAGEKEETFGNEKEEEQACQRDEQQSNIDKKEPLETHNQAEEDGGESEQAFERKGNLAKVGQHCVKRKNGVVALSK